MWHTSPAKLGSSSHGLRAEIERAKSGSGGPPRPKPVLVYVGLERRAMRMTTVAVAVAVSLSSGSTLLGQDELGRAAQSSGTPKRSPATKVEWTQRTPDGQPDLGPNLLPAQFSRPEKSPLVVKIAAGTNTLPPIVLK